VHRHGSEGVARSNSEPGHAPDLPAPGAANHLGPMIWIDMKKSQPYFFLISVFLVLFAGTHCRANEIEKKFMQAGLVNVHAIDQSIRVDLVNSHPDKNFFRENFYNGMKKAYLREEVARKLSSAQKNLKARFPDYSILIMDAARPGSVSRRMFNKMKEQSSKNLSPIPKKDPCTITVSPLM
jgi:D-alanyl-D-alanine dipeptidase